jgi:hypothetical protein
MTPPPGQLNTWRSSVEQLESEPIDVWARPIVWIVAGFALAAAALLIERLLVPPFRRPAEIATLVALAGLGLTILWRTRGTASGVVAQQIVTRVTWARNVLRSLPADVRSVVADDLGRLANPISPVAIAALTAFAMLVASMAAVASAGIAHALLPQMGQLNVGAGLLLAALLLPGYVRLLTLTAAQRLEERAALVERLLEISSPR